MSTTLKLMVKSKLQFQLIVRFLIYFHKMPCRAILVDHFNLIWYEIIFKILIKIEFMQRVSHKLDQVNSK